MKTFLIKMERNKRCPCCRLSDYECLYSEEPNGCCDGKLDERPDWCPLVEVDCTDIAGKQFHVRYK